MGHAPRFTAGVAALALLLGGGAAAAEQGNSGRDRQPRAVGEAKRDARTPVTRGRREASADKVDRAADTSAAPAADKGPSNAGSRGGGSSNSAAAISAAVTGVPPAATVAAVAPPGLSKDAPEVPPRVGVVGGGKGQGKGKSPSPAATPEPSTLLLMGAGLAGLYRLRRRQ